MDTSWSSVLRALSAAPARQPVPQAARRMVGAAVVVLVLWVALTSAAQHAAFDRALAAADFVERMQSMRLAAERLRRSASDALVTIAQAARGEPAALAGLDAVRDTLDVHLQVLALLPVHSAEQRELIGRARQAIEATTAGLLHASGSGADAPARLGTALQELGLPARLQIVGAALDALDAYEQRALSQWRDALDGRRLRTEFLLSGGNALALAGMLALLGLAVRAHLRARLAESDARYRVLFDLSPMPMWVLDGRTGHFLEANDAAVEKYGWSRAEFRQMALADPRLCEQPEAMRALLGCKDPAARPVQMRHLRRDGTALDVAMFVSDVVFSGRPARLAAIEDHTSRLAAERERRLMRRRIDEIVQKMTDGFMLFDGSWRIVYANERALRLLARSREQLLGASVSELFPALHGTAFERAARQVAGGEESSAHVEEFVVQVGRWFDAQIYSTDDGVAVLFQDTTRRRDAARLLQERERLLTELSRKLLRAQEDERRAIARELHDHLLQELAAAKLLVAAARREPDRARADARLDQALAGCNALIAQLRTRALDLHPAILEDLGLTAAVDWLCERQRTLTGAQIEREPHAPVPRLDRETEAAAFRIVQEAVTNALRHAQARRVRVCVSDETGRLRLTVADDGVGMSSAVREARLRDSLGLISMRERAELLGGRLTIESAPGQGTRVEAELPA